MKTSWTKSGRVGGGWVQSFRHGTRLVVALSLIIGLFAGIISAVFIDAASASTFAVSLDMTAGTFATQGGAPGPLPTMATPAFTATETTRAGTLNDATLKIPTQNESNTGSKETIIVSVAPATTVTATVNTLGDLTIAATLDYEVHITSPVTAPCKTATPVHVVLSSTAPYTTTSRSVTVKNSNITVPDFASCVAASNLDTTFSGPGGELGLTLHGTLVVPPPGTPTTVSLSATPTSPRVHDTSVTIRATVKKTTGTPATTAKGLVTFYDGTTLLGTESASGGTASYTTSALPVGTDALTAVYGGGGGYKGSTASVLTYVVKAPPTVSVVNLPATVTGDTATEHPFTVALTDPSNGLSWTQLYLQVTLSGIRHLTKTQAPLQFQDGSGTWCSPIDLASGTTIVKGYLVGVTSGCTPASYPASFSLASSASLTIHFRVSYPASGYYGVQKVTATLFTGSCSSATSCTAVSPLSGGAAPTGSATVAVVPSSPLGTTMKDFATRPATATVHKTFDVGLSSKLTPTTTPTTGLPAPT
ncbi:MAG: Ig-like domain-containing protein, partial [Candidatus Acidiferrales bacterium]